MKITNSIKAAAISAVLAGTSLSGSAAQIFGSITFNGGATMNTGSLLTATSVTAWSSTRVQTVSDDFATSGVATGDPAVFSAPWAFGGGGPQAALWDTGRFTFNLASSTVDLRTASFLNISGTGTVHDNGGIYDDTVGTFEFSTQRAGQVGNTFSFSAGTDTRPKPPEVPDSGSSLMLLGLALAGTGLAARRKA